MSEATEQLILILDTRAAKKVQARVAARIAANQCLGQTDEGLECVGVPHRLGICQKCYRKYRDELIRKSPKDAAVYTSRLIRLGRLLDRWGKKFYQRKSIYRRLA